MVTGDKRGAAELGYPTANVDVPDGICIPGVGIYAGWYHRRRTGRRTWRPSRSACGRTFYATGEAGARPVLEAYLIDFDGDLYGEAAAVRFVAKLRDERRFEQVSELISQMGAPTWPSPDDCRGGSLVLRPRRLGVRGRRGRWTPGPRPPAILSGCGGGTRGLCPVRPPVNL